MPSKPLNRNAIKKLIEVSESGAYFDSAVKAKWHRDMQNYAHELASEMGLTSDQYEVRSNKGGPAVLGEVMLHTEYLYVMFGTSQGILYRGCVKGGFKRNRKLGLDTGTGMSEHERNQYQLHVCLTDMVGLAQHFKRFEARVKYSLNVHAS